MSGARGRPAAPAGPAQSGVQSRDNPDLIVLGEWLGQNNQAAQTAIEDQEVWWSENLLPIGKGNLRALWGQGAVLATAATGFTFNSMSGWASFASGGTAHMIAFSTDGGGVDINLTTSTVTAWAADTFWVHATQSPYSLPIPVVQWGSAGVAILAPKGMFAWDGAILTAPGAAAPSWLTNGASTNLYTATGVWKVKSGESWEGRLWYAIDGTAGSVYGWSSPGNGADLTGALGSGTAVPTDPFLISSIRALVQSGTFLFLVGDNSINALSSVNTAGSPPVTTFTYANVDPEVGQAIAQAPIRMGRAITLFSEAGIFTLYGGAAQVSSDKIQTLFEAVNTTALSPTMALTVLHGIKCVLTLVNATDVFGKTRNLLLGWTGQKWFVASQESNLTLIATSQIRSNSMAYGTDGTSIRQLFAAASGTLTKRLTTKAYLGPTSLVIKQFTRTYLEASDIAGTGLSFSVVSKSERGSQSFQLAPAPAILSWTNNAGNAIAWTNNASDAIAWAAPSFGVIGASIATWGQSMFLDLQTSSEDFSIQQLMIGYKSRQLLGV